MKSCATNLPANQLNGIEELGNILKHPRAKIADVQCSRLQFQPGDRILVKVYQRLDKDQAAKLRKGIQKWAGPDVEILIYSPLDMEITIEKGVGIGN